VLAEWAAMRNRTLVVAAAACATAEGPRLTARAATALASLAALIEEARQRADSGALSGLLALLLRQSGYLAYLEGEDEPEERAQNVQELLAVASQYDALAPDSALATFLEDVALVADVDTLEDEGPRALTLITLHAAKGLEFPVVFLMGMEEGILPHQRSFDDPAAMEEERRLCYVGITRAKQALYLTYAFRRALGGMSTHNPRSRFLDDIPDEAVERRGRAISTDAQDVRPARNRWLRWNDFDGVDPEPAAVEALQPGDHVRHEAFGDGVVVACKPSGRDQRDQEVTVAFEDAGTKKLLRSLAPLAKV
jgi:DNA helicase-2/ATP-dependent DNA helicase PcrA